MESKDLERYFEEKVKENLHKWLTKLLSKPPIIIVIIEEKTPEVVEACKILTRSYETKILEFQTFNRQDAPQIHAHLFDASYELEPARENSKIEKQTPPQQINQPQNSSAVIDVSMTYKSEKHLARFDTVKKKVIFQGKEYSPSTAGSEITKKPINGRLSWKFIDSQGKVKPISELY
jgi:hypothetical protein